MILNIWEDVDHASWPEAIGNHRLPEGMHIFLGDVVNLVGELLHPDDWDQTDMLCRPISMREIPAFVERPIEPPMSIVNPHLRRVASAEEQLAEQHRQHECLTAEIMAHNDDAARQNATLEPRYKRAETVRRAILAAGTRGDIRSFYFSRIESVLKEIEPSVWSDKLAPGLFMHCAIYDRPWMRRGDQITSNLIFVNEASVRSTDWATVIHRRPLAPLRERLLNGADSVGDAGNGLSVKRRTDEGSPPGRSDTRWTEEKMKAEIENWTIANARRDREEAWNAHFLALQPIHGWDNRSFRVCRAVTNQATGAPAQC